MLGYGAPLVDSFTRDSIAMEFICIIIIYHFHNNNYDHSLS